MESQSISLQIPCSLHPSEIIQRVSMDSNTDHHIYCFECVLQQKSNPEGAPKILKPISELFEIATDFYTRQKENVTVGDHIPDEMTDILSGQAEKLETLTQHIEGEKKRVSEAFDSILQEFIKTIQEKKNEVLSKLDQQVSNLRSWYISFEKQLKRTYPTPEDIPVLYPTKEELDSKLTKITNSIQLTALVKIIKEDLDQVNGLPDDNDRVRGLNKKAVINNMSKKLLQIRQIKPFHQKEDSYLEKLKQNLRKSALGLMKESWRIQNPIPEVFTGQAEESDLLKAQDFGLIKSWLPQNFSFHPQLLYRGSRDGMNPQAFHKLCDGKENTITIIKTKFQGSDTIHILGGFLDQPWHSNAAYIHSTKSFVFSITKNIKCPQRASGVECGAYGNLHYGPCFGSGHDIGVWVGGKTSYMYPSTYKSSQLIESSVFEGLGKTATMEVLDIEVFNMKKEQTI